VLQGIYTVMVIVIMKESIVRYFLLLATMCSFVGCSGPNASIRPVVTNYNPSIYCQDHPDKFKCRQEAAHN